MGTAEKKHTKPRLTYSAAYCKRKLIVKKHFMEKHYASEEKADLALTVARKELDILTDMDYKIGYSLYIGSPFCPSICLYCSFSSYALGNFILSLMI